MKRFSILDTIGYRRPGSSSLLAHSKADELGIVDVYGQRLYEERLSVRF